MANASGPIRTPVATLKNKFKLTPVAFRTARDSRLSWFDSHGIRMAFSWYLESVVYVYVCVPYLGLKLVFYYNFSCLCEENNICMQNHHWHSTAFTSTTFRRAS